MKVTAATCVRRDLPLRTPYRIASGYFDHVPVAFLRVQGRAGLEGLGCACPAPEVTGETIQQSCSALRRLSAPLVGIDSRRHESFLKAHAEILETRPAARAALEMALLDLTARSEGQPLWAWLGARTRPMLPTSVTLGIAPLEATCQAAAQRTAEGFRALKVKGGLDAEEDARRLVALRRRLGPDIALRFDANQGYDLDQALAFVRGCREAGVEILEQPLPRAHDHLLGDLRQRIRQLLGPRAPLLMADESLLGVDDAVRLVAARCIDAFNIKLMKAGGLGPAGRICEVAREAGLQVMFSCMDEPALGIAAALHLALAVTPTPLLDLDGHLDLCDDPTAGAVRLSEGYLGVADRPGLGGTLPASA